MLSKNFQVSSNYACDMLIFVYFPKMYIFKNVFFLIRKNNKLSIEYLYTLKQQKNVSLIPVVKESKMLQILSIKSKMFPSPSF